MEQTPAALVIRSVEFVTSAVKPGQYPNDDWPQIAFSGRSNVGKSSLLNTLVNRHRLARVSSTPGHTRLLNFYAVNTALYFVDLPGYGFARVPHGEKDAWERMITSYLQHNPRLRLMLALFDIRREFADEDHILLEWLRHYQVPFAAILTKADKLPRSRQAEALRRTEKLVAPFGATGAHLFSAQTRQGRDDVLACIAKAVEPPGTSRDR